jgi:hypothetical protein
MDILEQALRGGLKPNMTNAKGDSLVSLGACDGTFLNVERADMDQRSKVCRSLRV